MPLKALMEMDINIFIAREILLYLSLADLLKCKRVSRAWNTCIQTLFGNEWTQWTNVQLAQKMSAAVSSVVGGAVVHKLHLNEKYEELIKQGYKLYRCYPSNGCICLQFRKIIPDSNVRKYAFCAISQDNMSVVQFVFQFEGICGYPFSLGDSIVIYWYTLASEDYIKLSFKVIHGMPTSFYENSYEKTILLSDFISPITAFHEIISGDTRLRTEIKNQFPELNFHRQYFCPKIAIVKAQRCYNHEIFYYQRPSNESSNIWVLDTNTMKVEFKRNTTKCDWVCRGKELERIQLQFYRHPFAIFFIEMSHTFVVWNLSQPGHPKHICFDLQLPVGQWLSIGSWVTKSKWIIQYFNIDKTCFIYVDLPSKRTLKNSSVSCNCTTQDQVCCLEENKLLLKSSQSSHSTFAYFIGERFIIEGTLQPPGTHIRDCWKS